MNKENLSILTSVEDMMKDENKRQLLKNFIEANES